MMVYQAYNIILLKVIEMVNKNGFNNGFTFNINKPDS